jgi:hypothetical protein
MWHLTVTVEGEIITIRIHVNHSGELLDMKRRLLYFTYKYESLIIAELEKVAPHESLPKIRNSFTRRYLGFVGWTSGMGYVEYGIRF